MKHTPTDPDKPPAKRLANLARKLDAGKPLTAREKALLAQSCVGGSDTADSAFAATWDDLAKRISSEETSITRRSIQEWRKDPRYSAYCPVARADGRHDVAAWAAFMVRFGLKHADNYVNSAGEDVGDGDITGIGRPPMVAGTVNDWNKGIAKLEYDKRLVALDTIKGLLIAKSELETPLGATFAAIQVKLSQFPERAARRVTGFTDVQEVEARLREEIDSDLSDLHSAEFLDVSIEEIVKALPFDQETEDLFRLVIFEGQDRLSLFKLISRVASEALRQLGRRAISCGSTSSDHAEVSPAAPESKTPEASAIAYPERALSDASECAAAVVRKRPSKTKPRKKKAPRKASPVKPNTVAKKQVTASPARTKGPKGRKGLKSKKGKS